MLMFRSVVTPLVSLMAVAFSYLCSMGIAAQLIDKAGFPITSLTQMLLILILFVKPTGLMGEDMEDKI